MQILKSKFIVNLAKCNLLRKIHHYILSTYSDEECWETFVQKMNDKNKEIGLANTNWINPSGLCENGQYSITTARDMAILVSHCARRKFIPAKQISIRRPYLFSRQRNRSKVLVPTTKIDVLGGKYPIVLSKTGSGDGFFTLAMICRVKNHNVAGVIMDATSDEGRFEAMLQLMSKVDSILCSKDDFTEVSEADKACAYLINEDGFSCIYEQNADVLSPPMSITKLMTVLVVNEYYEKFDSKCYVTPFDVNKSVGSEGIYSWDSLTIRDLESATLVESLNVAANTLARVVGEKILNVNKNH